MCGTEAFAGLDLADRQVLADWLSVARVGQIATSGGIANSSWTDGPGQIDRVIDFARRPWNVAGLDAVIGIFEAGSPAASWLLVRYESRWVLAQVGDDITGGTVSEVCDSLAEALDLIGTGRLG